MGVLGQAAFINPTPETLKRKSLNFFNINFKKSLALIDPSPIPQGHLKEIPKKFLNTFQQYKNSLSQRPQTPPQNPSKFFFNTIIIFLKSGL